MLTFMTQGQIPLDAFTVFGLNAKPNTESPIGYFGTGLKYAVAITLRLGGTFRMFRGVDEYEFYTSDRDFRNKTFSSVRMRKKTALGRWGRSIQLPFTLELGKNWDAWMAVRELESNTRDEGGNSCVHHEHDYPDPGFSMIVIECPEMEEAYDDGSIFLDTTLPTIETSSTDVEIYDAPSDHIYMGGIRVQTPDHNSLFTYNIVTPLELTEDRSPKYNFLVTHHILRALQGMYDPEAIDRLLALGDNSTYETRLDFDDPTDTPSVAFYAGLDRSGGGGFSRVQSYYKALGRVDMSQDLGVFMAAQRWQDWLNGDPSAERLLRSLATGRLKEHGVDV